MDKISSLVFLLFACLVSFDIVFATTIQYEKPRCVTMQKDVCDNVPYNETLFPNLFGHVDFAEAQKAYMEFMPLIKIKCSSQLEQFLCFLYFPVCTVLENPIPVCRAYCEEAVTDSCRNFLERVNMRPKQFECERYPMDGLCVNKDNTISKQSGNDNERTTSYQNIFSNVIYEDTLGESVEEDIKVDLFLLVSNGAKLQLLDISAPNKMDTITLYSRLPHFTTIDYYKPSNYIFWASNVDSNIYRGTLKLESLRDVRPIVKTGIASVETIAVDWHLRVLFWTEIMPEPRIRTSSLSGRQITTVLSEGLRNPISLTLDPLEGKLFWIDRPGDVFNEKASIETYSIVTNTHSSILNVSITRNIKDGGRPGNLVADVMDKKLYFIDARSEALYSINYDGSDFRELISKDGYFSEPWSLVVHGGMVIWTDSLSLFWANKTTGEDILSLKTFDSSPPRNIKVYGARDRTIGKIAYDRNSLDKKWQELSSKENMEDKDYDPENYYDYEEYVESNKNSGKDQNKKSSANYRSLSMILYIVTLVLILV
ncbi:Low-density lipoprotein receptor-related protein 1B [Mactra antiquata]